MEGTVTRPGTRNGGLTNVLEIERLIMQKQLVMNQKAIFAPAAFLSSRLRDCNPSSPTSVEGTRGGEVEVAAAVFFSSFPSPARCH